LRVIARSGIPPKAGLSAEAIYRGRIAIDAVAIPKTGR